MLDRLAFVIFMTLSVASCTHYLRYFDGEKKKCENKIYGSDWYRLPFCEPLLNNDKDVRITLHKKRKKKNKIVVLVSSTTFIHFKWMS